MSIFLNHVQRNIELAGISATVFASVAGMKQPTFSAVLCGRLSLSGEEEARLHTLALRCVEISAAIKPLVFEKGNAESVKALVESDLTVEQIRVIIGQLFANEESNEETV